MVATPVLLITDLIPAEARGSACALHTSARGTLGGAAVDVILADRDALIAGGDGALSPLLDPLPREIRLTPSCHDPAGDVWLHAALDALAPGIPRVIGGEATGDVPLILTDLGELTRDLLSNGLRWVARPDPTVERPDRLHGPLGADLGAALAGWWARCTAAFEDTDGADHAPARARQLRLEGAGLFGPEMSPWRVADALVRSPLELRLVELAGDDPSAVRRAAELVLRVTLLRPAAPEPALIVDGARQRPTELLDALPVAGRREDDQTRRAVFHTLARMPPELRDVATPRAEAALGPAQDWVAGFQRYREQGLPWVTLIPTWQCDLRCKYCGIVKQDGRVMTTTVVDGALDLLFSSDEPDVEVHFFGGEPLLNWPVIQHTVREGARRAADEGRRIRFFITTNAYSLTEAHLDWLAQFDVALELSLDGDAETMAGFRQGRDHAADTYTFSPANRARWFTDRGLPHTVIQVVHPDNVAKMAANFRHILDMGYRQIQLNFAIGPVWTDAAASAWAEGLHAIGAELEGRWDRGEEVMLVNLLETLRSYRVNLHPTVDWDGTVYAGTPYLYLERQKAAFRLGHLDDGHAIHRYVADRIGMQDVLDHWTMKGTSAETRRVGAVQKSFIRWMRRRRPDLLPAEATPLGAAARARDNDDRDRPAATA